MFGLNNSIELQKGIGKKTCEYFAKKDIITENDLITFLPISYVEYKENDFKDKEKIILNGTIITNVSGYRPKSNLHITSFKVSNGINEYNIIAWNQQHLKFTFKQKQLVEIFGVYDEKRNQITLNKITLKEENINNNNSAIIPIYSKINKMSNLKINKMILSTIDNVDIDKNIKEILQSLHSPKSATDVVLNQEKFKKIEIKQYLEKIEELKKEKNTNNIDNMIEVDMNVINSFFKTLPFDLTNAQHKVIIECLKEINSEKLLQSLILGDVGSGKTIVALTLALSVLSQRMQVAFMAPTDILARQIYNEASKYLKDYSVELLIGSIPKSKKNRIKDNLILGNINLLVGTQALLEDDVVFDNLKFVIIDEQHRFGVAQRQKLIDKGISTNYVYLSATPIPRTIAHTLYGVVDIYEIDQKPSNRKEIITKVFSKGQKKEMLLNFENELKKGNQGFIVTPLAYEIEDFKLADSYNTYLNFKEYYDGRYSIGVINGQLKPKDKEKIMDDFKEKKYDILVSTTVIEVGVDIPGATVMMILNAERFGIAQLHQLRGRVGRNDKQSFCLLQNTTSNQISEARINLMLESTNGYELAKEDYRLRKSGELLGIRQSGNEDFILFDPINDIELISEVQTKKY